MIIIGEMDGNLDPTSSLHVVNALVKADKHFDMLYIPATCRTSACAICRVWSRRIGIK